MLKSFAAAAVLVAAIAGPALAADAPVRAVSTSSVNGNDRAAVGGLYAQLRRASTAVCDSNSANPRITQADRACARKALDNAVRSARMPMLTAMHTSSQGATSAFALTDQ